MGATPAKPIEEGEEMIGPYRLGRTRAPYMLAWLLIAALLSLGIAAMFWFAA
jgi:hypothetical protein